MVSDIEKRINEFSTNESNRVNHNFSKSIKYSPKAPLGPPWDNYFTLIPGRPQIEENAKNPVVVFTLSTQYNQNKRNKVKTNHSRPPH